MGYEVILIGINITKNTEKLQAVRHSGQRYMSSAISDLQRKK